MKIRLDEIQGYKHNYKEHPREQIEILKKMINEYGFDSPIIVNKKNIIIAGHGRLQALKELGRVDTDVIVKSELTELQERKYRILDNRISELGKRNEDNIRIELDEIDDMEFQNIVIAQKEIDDIDFDDIKSNEDRQLLHKEKKIVCPECQCSFTI